VFKKRDSNEVSFVNDIEFDSWLLATFIFGVTLNLLEASLQLAS
jgi:hypothetical protein